MARRLRTMPQALSDELARLGGETAPDTGVDLHQAPAVPIEEAPGTVPIAFHDRHYRLRTLTGPGGRAIRVDGGLALAVDEETIAWLDEHPDFERND